MPHIDLFDGTHIIRLILDDNAQLGFRMGIAEADSNGTPRSAFSFDNTGLNYRQRYGQALRLLLYRHLNN